MALPVISGPGEVDITIYQGSRFSLTVTLQDENGDPIDLTGLTGQAMVRSQFSDTTQDAEITVSVADATAGVLQLSMTAAEAADVLGDKPSRRDYELGWWDLELIEGTERVRILQGKVVLSQEATK